MVVGLVGVCVWGGHGGECRCLKVKGRAANWGGSEVMSFSILSLSAPARWHHLAILSIHLTLHPPSTETGGRREEAGKNCLFPNRPPNLSGLGVMGHLHGEPSEAAAATAGL